MNKGVTFFIAEKTDAFSRIKKFMSGEESGVVLSATEEKMLGRMIYANGMLAENKYTEEYVANKIKEHHGVSIFTARNDIRNTYSLFVSVTEDYKRYGLFHHIEFLKQELQRCKGDKSMANLIPKLSDSLTKAYAAMPVKPSTPDIPQPIIVIDTRGRYIKATIDPDEADKEADLLIAMEEKESYIDFEETKKDE